MALYTHRPPPRPSSPGAGEEGSAHSSLQNPVSALRNPASCGEGGREGGQRRGAARLRGPLPAWGAGGGKGAALGWGGHALPSAKPQSKGFWGRGRGAEVLWRSTSCLNDGSQGWREARLDLRAAVGLASVCNVLCLPAMLCQYIFRVGGGSPPKGPQRAGQGEGCMGCLQRREGARLCCSPRAGTGSVFAWAGCSRPGGLRSGRGKAEQLLAGLSPLARLAENPRAPSKERPSAFARQRAGSALRGGVAGGGRKCLEDALSCLGTEGSQQRRAFPGQHRSWRQGQGQARCGDRHKQLRSPGLLFVISAPDVQTLQGPPAPLLLPSWTRAGLAAVMKCRAAWESRGGKGSV